MIQNEILVWGVVFSSAYFAMETLCALSVGYMSQHLSSKFIMTNSLKSTILLTQTAESVTINP
jgi:hypothetical protein